MSTVPLKITTRKGILFEGEVRQVTCPTTSGYITVLPHHTALVSVLQEGTLTIVTADDKKETYTVSHGVVEVLPKHIAIMLHGVTEHAE